MNPAPYTAERAYRHSVRPLGILLFVGGLLACVCGLFSLGTVTWLPFFESVLPRTRELVFAGLGLACAAIGVGLFFRARLAWYALFAYIALGTVWIVAGFWFDPQAWQALRTSSAIVALVLNGVLGLGLYIATKPAFELRDKKGSIHNQASNSDP